MRLQKYMAHAGLASRRKSEEIILEGRVKVNGQVVASLGTKVEEGDRVEVDGKVLNLDEGFVYYILNKPQGVLSTVRDDRGRKTVLDLLDSPKRIYPVGRLDMDTSGLLLLTNDGALTNALIHPSKEVDKTYKVTVQGSLSREDLSPLEKGISYQGVYYHPGRLGRIQVKRGKTLFQLTIHEGKNHQVKNMCLSLGHPVQALHRESFAGLDLKGLGPGDYRPLRPEEVEKLKEYQ